MELKMINTIKKITYNIGYLFYSIFYCIYYFPVAGIDIEPNVPKV